MCGLRRTKESSGIFSIESGHLPTVPQKRQRPRRSADSLACWVAASVGQGLVLLGAEHELPDLSEVQFQLFTSPEADPAIVAAVTQLIVEYCATRRG